MLARGLAPCSIKPLEFRQASIARGSGGLHDIDDVVPGFLVDKELIHTGPGGQDVADFGHGLNLGDGLSARHAIEDSALFFLAGITDLDLEHEPVYLGFGERICALLFDGVLGGEDKEGIRKREGLAAEGDLPFLHCFEQGGLNLGRGPVDLIGEDQVRKNRTLLDAERALSRVENLGSDHIGGQHVQRELDPGEARVDGLGEGLDGQGLGEPGQALE